MDARHPTEVGVEEEEEAGDDGAEERERRQSAPNKKKIVSSSLSPPPSLPPRAGPVLRSSSGTDEVGRADGRRTGNQSGEGEEKEREREVHPPPPGAILLVLPPYTSATISRTDIGEEDKR